MRLHDLDTRLRSVYAADTAQPHNGVWTPDNPAKGHCAVVAMIVQEYFGGEIMRCLVDDPEPIVHYYNKVGGRNIDLTWDQFSDNCVKYAIQEAELYQYRFAETIIKSATLAERAGV